MNVGLCLSDPHPQAFGDGSSHRTTSAIHFAGRYRLIDFMLSNMVNSGINTVALVLGTQSQTLLHHIGTGRDWDLSRSSGGIRFFPPYPGGERPFMELHDDQLQRALSFIADSKTDHVLVAECNNIFNIDFRDALAQHRATGADVTAIYAEKPVQDTDRVSSVAFKIDARGKVSEIIPAPRGDEDVNLSLGTYIIKKNVLLRLLASKKASDTVKFAAEVLAPALKSIKMTAWKFGGYSTRITTLETYFRSNMDMLDPERREPLFDNGGKRIYTNSYDSLPTKYGANATVRNSIIPNGCVIEGTVENSVLFRNVVVKAGAVVRNSILLGNTVVGANSELNWIVTDRSVIISENRNLLGYKTYPVYIAREKVV